MKARDMAKFVYVKSSMLPPVVKLLFALSSRFLTQFR